jgi:ATP-binding cassette subfamily F protein uup
VNYLRAEKISKHYGDRTLFEDLTLSIEQGQKIALIARNGTGKTNLLNILTGKETTDSGSVVVSKDITMAYLEQDPTFPDGLSVWDALFNSNNELLNAVAVYEKILEETEHDHGTAAMARLQAAMEDMDRLQAWDYETRIRQILSKLNIHHFEQLVNSLSGGQRKRLALAKILILQPDLVILDEPTNHLDLEMIEWLEGYLKSADMALLVVTHDRYFLDAVCNEIIEMDNGILHYHRGNYAYYLEKKADREFREGREVEKARNLLRKELEWMRRQPKARGTKSKSRIEAFYETQEKASKKVVDKKVELSIKMQRMGSKILELQHVKKSYTNGDRVQNIVNDFSYIMKPGERIGIIGRNGIGKSTFLNMVMGLEQPDGGHISKGETIVYGYYSQEGLQWKDDKRVLEVVTDIAEYIQLEKGEKLTASQLCKRFLFDDKMQHTFVSKLSGGEKRRLYLLTILMKNPNMLILDEPTNDLDIDTLNVLEDFLETFRGCLLIVTHDRYFMDKLVDHLLIFEGDGIIRDYNGNYQDFLMEKDQLKEQASQVRQQDRQDAKVTETKVEIKSKNSKPTFKEQTEFKELGHEIKGLTQEKEEIERALLQPEMHYEEIATKAGRLETIKQLLDEKEVRWLELEERING